jgi:flagellar L-ring protein precursor FlgH
MTRSFFRATAATLVAFALGACAALAPRPEVQVLEPRPQALTAPPAAAAPAAPGTIYNVASHRPLFEDRRARLPGDILTIQIQEKTSARQSSNTKLGRDGKLSGAVSAVPFFNPNSFSRASVGGQSSNSLDAKGETGSDNTFNGVITVTVLEVLPNGNLVVTGQKQVGVNQNVDVMRFSGVVNPANIQAGNLVSSTQVADARLEVRGRGDIDRAQTTGWLSRFFLSWLPI